MDRKRLIRLIHVAKRELKLQEGDYRAVLASTVGKESCSDMSEAELDAVLKRLKELGFTVQVKSSKGGTLSPKSRHKRPASKRQKDLIRALWINCYQVGAVDNRFEQALNAFVKRLTGVDNIEWLRDTREANKVIEALKNMYARKAGEPWQPGTVNLGPDQ
jgi:phage gp16-like protein